MKSRLPAFLSKDKICIICEGDEEYDYLNRLKELRVWNEQYEVFLDNADGNGNIPARYQDRYQNGSFEVVLVFCDTEKKPYEQYEDIKRKINVFHGMHIDLPLYAKSDDKVYLARGKEFSEKYLWEIADPKGLNDDLCGKINKNEQLRRVIRYIKKWRNDKYENSTLDHEVPPSIGLTYLACDCFVSSATSEGEDDLMALQQTMSNMKSMFTLTYEDEKLVK